jgi:hypothetical protein
MARDRSGLRERHGLVKYHRAPRARLFIAGFRFVVVLPPVGDLLLCAKHLFGAAKGGDCPGRGLKDEQWKACSVNRLAWRAHRDGGDPPEHPGG